MAKGIYTIEAAEKLISQYEEKGGIVTQTDEGGCGIGNWILSPCYPGQNLYSFIITEVYLNEWSSAQKIRRYKKLPKKYQVIVDNS